LCGSAGCSAAVSYLFLTISVRPIISRSTGLIFAKFSGLLESRFKRFVIFFYVSMKQQQSWLFSCTSTYHSTDLLTERGVAHLVVHGTSGLTSSGTIPPIRLETSGGVLLTVDMVVQRRDGPGPRRLHDHGDDDD